MEEKEKNINEKKFPELPELKEKKKINYIVTFLFILIFLYSRMIGLIMDKLKIQTDINQEYIISIIMSAVSSIILYLVLKETLKRDIKYYVKNFKKYFKYGVCVLFIFGIVEMIVGGIILLVIGNKSDNEVFLEQLPYWYQIIYTIILAPFIEECMFRGLLKKIIKNKYIFLIISSIFFGAMHVIVTLPMDPLQWLFVIQYSIVGFALAYNYEKTGNLTSSIVIHMINNIITTIL